MSIVDRKLHETPRRDDPHYTNARTALERGDDAKLRALAAEEKTHPEMLYYLASNGDDKVRRLVAENLSTPIQADEILAKDDLADVRETLALKIGRILPDLSSDARSDVGDKSLDILQTLAGDELPRVRVIVAEAIKSSKHIPAELARTLAQDIETAVSAPVLQYSPLLTDQDLSEIIAAGAASGALDAIAKRANLSERVSDDLVSTLDPIAIASLLSNDSAQIREDTLDAIIDTAPEQPGWHAPLAGRSELSLRAMKRISSFVASYLVSDMIERHNLSDDAAEDVLTAAREKIAAEHIDDDLTAQWQQDAQAYYDQDAINDTLVRTLIKENKRGVLIHCIALAAEIQSDDVAVILRSKDGKLLSALAWKAGLTMRTSVAIQRSIALINGKDVLYGKDGFDYPLEDKDMDWLLASHLSE